MMADAGLRGIENNFPGEISSGVRRRVEIVRALMNDPKILLLDEPYRALDSLTKSVMHEALLEIYYKNRVTIFFITHDLEEAIFLGHRVVIMTTRPCRPKKILDIDIPHPRDYSVLTTQALSRVDGRDHRGGARGGPQGLCCRREGALTMAARKSTGAHSVYWPAFHSAMISGAASFSDHGHNGTLEWLRHRSRIGLAICLPWVGAGASPHEVLRNCELRVSDPGYWQSCAT